MRMAEVVGVGEGDCGGLRDARGGGLVEPMGGLDIVLRVNGPHVTCLGRAKRRRAEPLEEIVRRAVFLEDHDDVFEARDLGGGGEGREQDRQQDPGRSTPAERMVFHKGTNPRVRWELRLIESSEINEAWEDQISP